MKESRVGKVALPCPSYGSSRPVAPRLAHSSVGVGVCMGEELRGSKTI